MYNSTHTLGLQKCAVYNNTSSFMYNNTSSSTFLLVGCREEVGEEFIDLAIDIDISRNFVNLQFLFSCLPSYILTRCIKIV